MTKMVLVTGFLGAGKTTFLKNYIHLLSDSKIYLIINEFGREGIDGQILKDLGVAIEEINNGSIFCSCRLNRFEEVLKNAIMEKPDVILVETSGLSNPTNISKIINQTEISEKINYVGCICLVDTNRFQKVYSTATVVKKQIIVSNLILLNKVDLCPGESLQLIKDTISQINPEASIYETKYGAIKKKWIKRFQESKNVQIYDEMQKMDITIRSNQININETFTYNSLIKFLEMFIDDTYRVKGFVRLEGNLYLIDCVGPALKLQKYNGNPTNVNSIIVLSNVALPTMKSIKKAIEWYPEGVREVL